MSSRSFFPKISVIIPVFNSYLSLDSCLSSVFSQTYSNYEIIAVDDGSTDNSGVFLDDLAINDSRLVVIHQINQGPSSARNKGIDISSGDIIVFLDSDDKLVPDALSKISLTLAGKSKSLAMFGYLRYEGSKLVDKFSLGFKETLSSSDFFRILWKCRIENYMWAFAYSRDLFFSEDKPRFPVDINIMEDAILLNKVLQSSKSVYPINDFLYVYSVHPESLTNAMSLSSVRSGVESVRRLISFSNSLSLDNHIKSCYLLHLSFFLYDSALLLSNQSLILKTKSLIFDIINHFGYPFYDYKLLIKTLVLRSPLSSIYGFYKG